MGKCILLITLLICCIVLQQDSYTHSFSHVSINNKKRLDGYYFEHPTRHNTKFSVEIKFIDDRKEMQQMYLKSNGKSPSLNRRVIAFSTFNSTSNKCTIYITDPRKRYVPEIIGHELTHCMFGMWHNSQN